MGRNSYRNDQKPEGPRYDDRIRIPEVRVVHDGQNLGIMKTKDALYKARKLGLNLVEVAPKSKPPVCQIMDYGKYMYEKSKKQKDNKASQIKEKEIAFRYVIDKHDLETKANQAVKFLEKDHRIKLVVKFKQREKAHKDQGFIAIRKVIDLLDEYAEVDKEPAFEGHNITAKLKPRKKKKVKSEQGSSDPAIQSQDDASGQEPLKPNA